MNRFTSRPDPVGPQYCDMINLSMRLFYRLHITEFIIILIFSLGFILRFTDLSSIPNGLYPDETALGYNAYSILQTGKDEYGISYPIYFRSFDDYKLPVYIYSTAFFIKIFGASVFAVRFTSALFGSLSIIALFFLVYELSKNKLLAGFVSFSLAINPWHSFFSRAGYEVNVATSLIVIGMLFFIMAINRKNCIPLFIFSTISFLLSVYTYNVTRLIAPIILIALIAFYFKKITCVSKKPFYFIVLLFLIGMIPFIVSFISLQSEPGFSSQQDALIIGNVTRAELIETRSYFINLPNLVQKLLFNYWLLVGFTYVKNLVSFFSTSFFFIGGSDHPNQNITGMAMFYYFEFPFIIYGLYYGLKKRASFLYPFFLWLLIIIIFGALIKSVPNGTRTYPVVIPLTVLSGYGFYLFIKSVLTIKYGVLKYGVLSLLLLFITYSSLYYFVSYYVRYPIEHAKDWRSEDQRTVEYIKKIEDKYNKIVFEQSSEFFYTSLIFYGKYSPIYYQKNAKYRMSGLINTLDHVGKYEFRNIDWKSENPKPNTLYITGAANVPENVHILEVFAYPPRPVAIYYDRKIGQLSVTDKAYILFESQK